MVRRSPDCPASVCSRKVPTPTPISPSTTSVHRATRTTKRRRVMRGTCRAELEVGADGEGEREPAEEGVLARRGEVAASGARQLLEVAGGVPHGGNGVARRDAV